MYKENTQTLRNSIKKYMSDNDLTMLALGKHAGIHPASISRILSGAANAIQVETLEKLKAIGIQVDSSRHLDNESCRYRICFELLSMCKVTNDILGISAMMNQPEIADALEEFVFDPFRGAAKLLLCIYKQKWQTTK